MFRQLLLMLQIIESKQTIFPCFFCPWMQSKICWQATCCLVIVVAQAGEAEIIFSFVGILTSCCFNCFFISSWSCQPYQQILRMSSLVTETWYPSQHGLLLRSNFNQNVRYRYSFQYISYLNWGVNHSSHPAKGSKYCVLWSHSAQLCNRLSKRQVWVGNYARNICLKGNKREEEEGSF